MAVYQTAPQTVIIQAPPTGPTVGDVYSTKQSVFLGATQLICGVLCIIFQSVALATFENNSTHPDGLDFLYYIPAPGIWCGITFIISGSFGIAAGKTRAKCPIITFMVLSIIFGFLFDIFLITWTMFPLLENINEPSYDCDDDNYFAANRNCSLNPPLVASLLIIEICGFAYFLTMIWAIVIVSAALCCRGQKQMGGQQQQQVAYVQGVQGQSQMAPGQPSYVVQGQPMYVVQGQPAAGNFNYVIQEKV